MNDFEDDDPDREADRVRQLYDDIDAANGLPPLRERLTEGDDRGTELANAEEFNRRHYDDFHFDADRAKWLHWDGKRWVIDIEGHAKRAAMAVAKSTGDRLAEIVDPKDLRRFVIRAESAAGINGVLTLAQAMPGITVTSDRLDADDWCLNVQNGTIDLRSGRLRPHRRSDLNTIVLSVPFDAAASAPLWQAFLHRVMGGNLELIGYLPRTAGVAPTGTGTVHELPILYGQGGNGKSVFVDTLIGLLGDYASVAPDSLLVARSHGNEHPTEIADLRGKRLVVGSETEAGATLRINFVKKITGDVTLKGRFMRGDYFEFRRTHKTWLVSNNRPRLPEDSEAVWRRLRIIPFTVTIPPGERDTDLIEKLKGEWSGILAWCVRGCLDWQVNGMRPPQDVLIATEDYRAEADELADFIAAKCIVGDADTFRVSRADLLAAYVAWSKETNERKPFGKAELYEALRRRDGIEDGKWKVGNAATRGFTGIGLAFGGDDGGR